MFLALRICVLGVLRMLTVVDSHSLWFLEHDSGLKRRQKSTVQEKAANNQHRSRCTDSFRTSCVSPYKGGASGGTGLGRWRDLTLSMCKRVCYQILSADVEYYSSSLVSTVPSLEGEQDSGYQAPRLGTHSCGSLSVPGCVGPPYTRPKPGRQANAEVLADRYLVHL